MRSILRAAAGLCLLLLTSACLVETEATLGDPDPKAADARLIGSWYHASSGEVVIFSVVADEANAGATRVTYASIKPNAESVIGAARYVAWPTVINGRTYLNVRRVSGSDTPALMIMAYDFAADGSLVLRFMDTKPVAAAIAAGKLKGTVKKGTYTDEIKITATRAELVAFIAASDREKLFSGNAEPLRKLAEMKK